MGRGEVGDEGEVLWCLFVDGSSGEHDPNFQGFEGEVVGILKHLILFDRKWDISI